MNFGLIVVGDEILSGRRQDKHLAKVTELLGARGLQLTWAEYVGDERERLAQTLRRSFDRADAVFCCGGIGATPDDQTRQATAAALGVPLVLHPQAKLLITQRCAEMAARGHGTDDMSHPDNRQRLKMGELPVGCEIVPNAYNGIPGYSIRNHFFVPGFPVMAWPMIEWVLETKFRELFHHAPREERSFLAYEVPESVVTPLLEEIERNWPGVKTFSLPSVGDGRTRRHIELGVKGAAGRLESAYRRLEEGIRALGVDVGEAPK